MRMRLLPCLDGTLREHVEDARQPWGAGQLLMAVPIEHPCFASELNLRKATLIPATASGTARFGCDVERAVRQAPTLLRMDQPIRTALAAGLNE
jgi:hypothetical protein